MKLRHRWEGWDDEGSLRFTAADKEVLVEPDVTVLALGGASWPKLGSDARWAAMLRAQEIAVTPLRPANCGFTADWSEVFQRFEGEPLKRIAIALRRPQRARRGHDHPRRHRRRRGLCAVVGHCARRSTRNGDATIAIDLLPDVAAAKLRERLSKPRGKQSLSNFLRKATHLSPAALALVREAALGEGACRCRH